MFGARGLGLPGRPLTARAQAMGGTLGLFDGESDLNPAALVNLNAVSAGFVTAPTWRRWEGPAGPATLRDTRFPLATVVGPIPGTHLGVGVSVGSYGGRDFRLASSDSITLRGQAIEVHDTLTSIGGLGQIRIAAGWSVGPGTNVGVAGYRITGSSRLDARRTFSDTTYLGVRQTSELSYSGWGAAIGISQSVGSAVHVGLVLRSDGHVNVDRDSARVYSVDLPYAIYAGAAFRVSGRLTVVASGSFRSWSSANADLVRQGGVGARDMTEVAIGAEYLRNARRPLALPLRVGLRYSTLPFPIEAGGRPTQVSLSAGTGARFANERASLDVALEQTWRREGSAYRERALSLILGLSVRPYGLR